MAVSRFRDWMEGDEIVRITFEDELQFGKILEQNIDRESFKVAWNSKSSPSPIFDDNYYPDDLREKMVQLLDRRHHEGEKVVHSETGMIGEIIRSKILATVFISELRCVIQSVPMSLLTVSTLSTGERIYFKGWIGKVSSVKHSVLLEYSDGTQGWMEMGQHVRNNVSFGFDSYQKSTPPFPGVRVKPTPKEFETMKWLGTGFLESIAHLFNTHKDEICKVIESKIKRVHVKWLRPLNDSGEPKPENILESEDLLDVIDFDMQFKDWMKTHSICQYIIREEDEGIEENTVDDRFIQNMLNQSVGPNQDVKRLRPSPRQTSGYKAPIPGDKHFVEVIRINHAYWVDWSQEDDDCDNDAPDSKLWTGFKLEAGCELSPYTINSDDASCPHPRLEPFQIHQREYVLPKFVLDERDDVLNLIGVTQHRNLKNEQYLVDFYGDQNPEEESGPALQKLFLGRHEISKYDLFSHCVFGELKPGAIVSTRRNLRDIAHNVGTVLGINHMGMVDVHFGTYADPRVMLCSPLDLIVRNLPEEDNINKYSCSGKCLGLSCPLDEERVDFAECVANDLKEFQENQLNPHDIRIKQKMEGSIASFSVLMTGPKGTPYEHGLFEFDLQLPPAYPEVPPIVKLESLPPCGTFLSYHFCKDWTVRHPRYKNWEPENSKRHRWGWCRKVGLLNFLREIREDVFATEPILEKAGLRFKDKNRIFRHSTKLAMKAMSKNADIIVTTLDLLIAMKESQNEFWTSEISAHYEMVKPFQSKMYLLGDHSLRGDTCMIPKFQLFPMSIGFRQSISRRIRILSLPSNFDIPSDPEE